MRCRASWYRDRIKGIKALRKNNVMGVLELRVPKHEDIQRITDTYLKEGGYLKLPIGNESFDNKLYKIGLVIDVVYDCADNVITKMKKETAERGLPVTCYSGCDACCYQPIGSTMHEAILTSLFLKENPEIYEKFSSKYSNWRRSAGNLNQYCMLMTHGMRSGEFSEELKELTNDYFSRHNPCPFLEQHLCTAYPVRPFICRSWLSVDNPEKCTSSTVAGFLTGSEMNKISDERFPEISIYLSGTLGFDVNIYGVFPLFVHEICKHGDSYIKFCLNNIKNLFGGSV
jgi:Fe-S-cluster containining protein